eukprot:COSAG01_NODE_4837_length_4695_cov_90.434508_2_plen_77_part_00
MNDMSYSKQYYHNNREKILAYQREYYRSKKKKRNGEIQIKHGSFLLFGAQPTLIDWTVPCACSECKQEELIMKEDL